MSVYIVWYLDASIGELDVISVILLIFRNYLKASVRFLLIINKILGDQQGVFILLLQSINLLLLVPYLIHISACFPSSFAIGLCFTSLTLRSSRVRMILFRITRISAHSMRLRYNLQSSSCSFTLSAWLHIYLIYLNNSDFSAP